MDRKLPPHDQGEQDRANGESYNPPGPGFIFQDEEEAKDVESYKQGWRNHREQTK